MHADGIKKFMSSSVAIWPTSDQDVEVVMQHASNLYLVMILSHDEFQRVLYSNRLTDVSYLVNAAKILKELNLIYENDNQLDEVITIFENQITMIAEMFLPELACVSFKSLKDGYSDSLSGQQPKASHVAS